MADATHEQQPTNDNPPQPADPGLSAGSSPTEPPADTTAAESFARTIELDMPPIPPEAGELGQPAEEADNPEVTAAICVEGVDALCRIIGGEQFQMAPQWSLAEGEKEELREALTCVFEKYDVPDLPYLEEVRLAMASVAIAVPRVRRYMAERRGEVVTNGGARPRQEEVREDRAPAEIGVPPTDPDRPAPSMAL